MMLFLNWWHDAINLKLTMKGNCERQSPVLIICSLCDPRTSIYIVFVLILLLISDIFPSTFLQPVNDSKKSTLNWVMKVNLFICFFFEKPLEDFPLDSPILLTLWLRYLQTCIKESCVYISSQMFFKILCKTPTLQEKSKKNTFSSDPETYISKSFHLVPNKELLHGAVELSKQ